MLKFLTPTSLFRRLRRRVRPIVDFIRLESFGGILLVVCAAIALLWANGPYSQDYHDLFHLTLTVQLGPIHLSHPLHYWINEGLMALFFLVVGLEIKRELVIGELSTAKLAALPIAAAIGGMLVPALIFTAFNHGTPSSSGWGIPMATDIAFSLGVLALLGKSVPFALKTFLAALAIVDDLGAVLVIAIFYTQQIDFVALLYGAAFFAALLLVGRLQVRSPLVYVVLGIALWLAFLQSGVHPTIAGVLIAMAIPARVKLDTTGFVDEGRTHLDAFERNAADDPSSPINVKQQAAVHALALACRDVEMPVERLENALHPYVTFAIMPIFALANAGVPLSGDFIGTVTSPLSLGIALGLLIGKPVGIVAFSYAAVKAKLANLPGGVNWLHVTGVAALAGIGFTMSLFIAGLAFEKDAILDTAKTAILCGSLLSGLIGWGIMASAKRGGERRRS